MNKEEFKNYVNEIAINELRNSFDNNLMETLNSAFIFKYVETLEQKNQKYKEVIDKVKKIIFQPNIEIREYRSCDMDYVYINEQLLEILNEVNK